MPLFSSSRPSTPSKFESTTTATLGGAQISLTLLEKMTDGVPVPFVKAAAGTTLEVIKMAQVMQANREECDDLIKRCSALLVVILATLKGKSEYEVPSDFKHRVESLTSNLLQIFDELKMIDNRAGKASVRSKVKAGLYHFDNARKLTGCSAKLDWALQEFQVTSKVDSCLKDLERHEQLRKEMKEGKAELRDGQVELRDGQKDLQQGQAEIQECQRQILDAINNKANANVSTSPLSTTMPPCPKIFGRNEYIAVAIDLIQSNTSARLAILGPGGMGKTSVALCIVHDTRVISRFGQNIIWVPCEQATSVPLIIELLGKSILPTSSSSNIRFAEILSTLKSSKECYLLLLDNLETPWDIPGQQSEVADILAHLASISTVSFIVTMRGAQPPASGTVEWTHPKLPPLPPLGLLPANQAFLRIAPDAAGDSELNTLLKELDCVPLAVTLMARLAEAGEPPSELLLLWRSEKTKLLDQPEGDRRNSIEVSIKLSLESRLVKANPDAVDLLSIFAVLPAGASLSKIDEICPSIPKWRAALRVLRNTAVVYDSVEKKNVQLLSPIRSYVLLHHPLKPALLSDLRAAYFMLANKGGSSPGDAEFIEHSKEIEVERVNLEAVLLDSLSTASEVCDDNSQIIRAAYNYSIYLSWLLPQTMILEKTIAVARASGSDLLPSCLHLLGKMLYYQNALERAYTTFLETKEEYIRMGNELEALRCSDWIGDTLRLLYRFDEAYSVLKEGRDKLLRLGDSRAANLCLESLGLVLSAQCRYDEAESTLEQARTEFIKEKNDWSAYECLRFLSHVYFRQGRFEEAQRGLEEVRQWQRGAGVPTQQCQLALANIFFATGNCKEAWSVLEEARIEFVERGIGREILYAQCLFSGGRAARKLGNCDVAINRLEEAKFIFSSLGDSSRVDKCSLELEIVHMHGGLTESGH